SRTSVLLPPPFGPRIPKISRRRTSKLTSSTARTTRLSFPLLSWPVRRRHQGRPFFSSTPKVLTARRTLTAGKLVSNSTGNMRFLPKQDRYRYRRVPRPHKNAVGGNHPQREKILRYAVGGAKWRRP